MAPSSGEAKSKSRWDVRPDKKFTDFEHEQSPPVGIGVLETFSKSKSNKRKSRWDVPVETLPIKFMENPNVIDESNIDACRRLGRAREGVPTPGAIVRCKNENKGAKSLVQRSIKEELLRKRRVKRDFSTVHIGLIPIHINESLCPEQSRL
ncbi:hypothetical protein LSTR_LSTR007635 [Laodelphax striatellus]|uniref:Uncharacterized protein n=1 Tax=Laodelphax striatellus TaxID=195883 RepID=A0A482WIX6_LAOST|nr:hypothetical protein LSTR_LSTR007635 [Laodelphax striatellus]